VAASIALMAVGIAAILVEVFVPAGGLVGLAGAASIVASVAFGFARVGPVAGSVLLLVALGGVPPLLFVALKLFPRSAVGRWLVLSQAQRADEGYAVRSPEEAARLLGKQAVTVTPLRPVGTAEIDGRRYSVVTEGEYVDGGRSVRVVRVEGSRILVREG